MIIGLTVILLCQLLGEVVARGFGWPVPGPVLGMVFLLAFLSLRDRIRKRVPEFGKTLDSTGKGLLAHLSLLFIPASVGEKSLASTLITLVVTVVTFVVVSRLGGSSMETADPAKAKAGRDT
jgi:holin-like protein